MIDTNEDTAAAREALARLKNDVTRGAKLYVMKVGHVGRSFSARLFVVVGGDIVDITGDCLRVGLPGKMRGNKASDGDPLVTFGREYSRTDIEIAKAALCDVLRYNHDHLWGIPL